jgi:STE24 endopeptidase
VSEPKNLFSLEEVDRAHRYHRPSYVALAVDLGLAAGVLAALAFTSAGSWLFSAAEGLPWAAATAVEAALVVVVSELVRLPIAWWRGYFHERRWGFSTQTPLGWAGDVAKQVFVAVVLTASVLVGLVALVRAADGSWPLPAAAAFAGLVLVLGFVAPVVLEPLFNQFQPLPDEQLADSLRSLSVRAGVPVHDVLVADASRRTTKLNAYVSGLGRTRRIVVYDTLLEAAGPPEVRLVVAHELGHRRERHVGKLTALGMLGAVVATLAVWGVLSWPAALDAAGASGAGDPRIVPLVLLAGLALELLALPAGSALSRRWERVADRCSLDLTDDPVAFERAHVELARRNLSDLAPPRWLYLLMFSHPTPPERIAAARAWARS